MHGPKFFTQNFIVHKIVHKYKLMIDKRILRHFIAHKNVHMYEMMIDKQILRRDDGQ